MRVFTILILMLIGNCWAQSSDPCASKASNAETRECYFREQVRVNRQADEMAKLIQTRLRSDAEKCKRKSSGASDLLVNASSSLAQSQIAWKAYRNHYCKALMYTWTTGSGAGTTYEQCEFEMGKARADQLKADFPELSVGSHFHALDSEEEQTQNEKGSIVRRP